MTDHLEVERTYAPGADTGLPDLTALPGVVTVGEPERCALDAVYFDTADLALTRAGVSLRRHTGGGDQGWHLKIPAGVGREEIRIPLDPAVTDPPETLCDAVLGWSRGSLLAPVATVATRRTTYALRTADGSVLAEVADDRVSGVPTGGGPVAWREWEVELVTGDLSLLASADELMDGLGVAPSRVQRKIEVVLGERLPEPLRLRTPRRDKPAARVLRVRLAEQVAELVRCDSRIRRGDPEGVHRARVACRRLRSVLATYRSLLEPGVTDPLRVELRWLAGALGSARDAWVVHDRLVGILDSRRGPGQDCGQDSGQGRLRGRLDRSNLVRTASAAAEVGAALASPRYFRLLDDLDRLVEQPPWTAAAGRPAGEVLPACVDRDWKRLSRRVRAIDGTIDGAADRDVALHDARKAAKRLRYGAETLVPLWPRDARRLALAAVEVGTLLGERQDIVLTRPVLAEQAAAAAADGESTRAYDEMDTLEAARADALESEVRVLWDRVARAGLPSWVG